MTKIVFT